MQAQLYNQEKRYNTFSELVNNSKGAENLHFLVSTSVAGYLQQLSGMVPDVKDNLGRLFLTFKHYRFEIIESGISDKSLHRVAINFYSDPMQWHDTIDNYLLLSAADREKTEDGVLTHLLQLQPFLSIYSLKETV